MIRIFVDSGSSIKQEEKRALGVEILPLKIMMGDDEYLDGVNLSIDQFYHRLIQEGLFPKTSLPSLSNAEKKVRRCLDDGDDVLIITLSSGISGTYQTFRMLFADEERVRVIDSKTAVGGIRILVEEANRHRNEPLEEVAARVEALIPKLVVAAIPETLAYLHKGGRLSKTAFVAGTLAHIKPIISLNSKSGKVQLLGKAMGIRRGMLMLANLLEKHHCDENYPIIPSYTYGKENLDQLIALTDPKYHKQMSAYDNLDPAVACHWGPNAFGYIFVSKG